MAEIEFKPDELSVPELLALGSRLSKGLTNNENFPAPPLDQISGSLEELKAKQEQYRAQRLQLNALKLERDALASQLKAGLLLGVNYVRDTSGGDTRKIMSANLSFEHGVDLWPFNDPKQVHELGASAGDKPGEVNLAWDPVRGADGYEVEISQDLGWPVDWKACTATAQSKTTVEELQSRIRYWFRVRAVNEKGLGHWSDPVTKYAP